MHFEKFAENYLRCEDFQQQMGTTNWLNHRKLSVPFKAKNGFC
jgi:hypothetical protein